MAEDQDIQEPQVDEAPQQIGGGQPQPPAKLILSDDSRRKLDSIVSKMVANKEKDEDIQAVVNDFKQKYATPPSAGKIASPPTQTAAAPAPQAAPVPEHEVQHTPIQDIRHVQDLANQPLETHVVDPQGGLTEPNPESLARNKAYQDQFTKMAGDLGTTWGTKPETVKQVLTDFPDEQDEAKLKNFANLAQTNPVSYSRLKNGNDIRIKMAQDGPDGVHDANVFNHLLNATDYNQLTQENLPYQIQLMRAHGMGQADIEKLKDAQRPLINSTDPGLNIKYWQTNDHEYDLTREEYAGLETERLFNPNKAAMDEAALKHARGIGEDGKANPIDVSKESYEYQRGLENIKYNLQQTGRDNLARYVNEQKPDVDKQVAALKDDYQNSINNAKNTQEQQALIQEFQDNPVVQKANQLEDAQQGLQYSASEDVRRYPLNFSDQATRAVSEAMDHTSGFGSDAATWGGNVLQGAGQTADNTIRFIKNTAINILGSDESKAINNTKNIGHQALTELAAYEPTSYTGTENPIIVPKQMVNGVQDILNGPGTDVDKQQKALSYVRNNFDQLQANPKAGQQNITGKSALFQAANVMGQILGVANQSFLLGGAIGDASKLQQMATAFTPMYMSTQNQMYEQALKNGDEHPFLKSNIDATIISLASLINPDLKVVKGMVGAETGVGKMLAGIDESTWNKVISDNKPLVDRAIAGAKATGKQLGLANLQYGVIAPTAEYLAHKSVLNEDPNLGDMIKDGVIQTSISMALPSLLHGYRGWADATKINPQQKFAIVEAGLKPDQNIDLIDSRVKAGTLPEQKGHEMKMVIKHAGIILENKDNFEKKDGTPMNEKEVSDVVYNQVRMMALQGKLKSSPEPLKPVIQEQIHQLNKEISDQYTSDSDKQTADLNQLLHDNLDLIDKNHPLIAGMMREDIKNNEPEKAFRRIAGEVGAEKEKENGDMKSLESIYGKKLISRAIDFSQNEKNVSRGNIENKNNVLNGEQGQGVRQMQDSSDKETGSKVLLDLPQRVYERMAEDPSIKGNSEKEGKLQSIRTRVQGSGLYSEEAMRGMSESERGDAPRRLLQTYRSEMGLSGLSPEDSPEGERKTRTSSFLESRHADTMDDEKGLVSGPNDAPISKEGRKDANDLANSVEGKGVTKIITSDLERAKQTGQVVADKTGATVEHRPELNTWDIGDFDKSSDEEFKKAQKFFVENPDAKDFEGKHINESFNEYKDRVIKARDELEKEPSSTLVVNHSNNMMLWDAYEKNGHEWNEQAAKDYLISKTPEPATLTDKSTQNAIPNGSENIGQDQGSPIDQQGKVQGSEPNQSTQPRGATNIPKGSEQGVEEWPFKESAESLPNGIKKIISEGTRAQMDLPKVEFPKMGTDAEVLRAGKEAVDNGKINPRSIAARVAGEGGIYTPAEGAAMQYYGHQLRQAESDLRSDLHEANALLKSDPDNTAAFYAKVTAEQKLGQLDDEIELKTRADRTNSNSWGKLGNVMQIETDESFSPSRNTAIIAENYGGKIPDDVQARLDKAFAERDQAIADLKAAKEQAALEQIKKDAEKPGSKIAKTIREKKEVLKQDRIRLIEELKAAIKKDSGQLGANPLPINTIEAISKLALNYFKDGVLSVEGITNKIYSDLKDVVDGIDINQIREAVSNYQPLARSQEVEKITKKAANKEVTNLMLEERRKTNPNALMELETKKPKTPFEKNTEYIKAKQRLTNAEFKIKKEKLKSYAAKESRVQKTLGWVNRLVRLSVLSGVKVLEKLSAAATIGSAAQKPVEEVLNGIWGTAFSKIKAKSDIELGGNALAVVKYYGEFFDPVKFAKDTRDIIVHGETQLGKELEKQLNTHIPILDLPTDLHQVIKAPVKRAMFQYALAKILDSQQKQGIDINHPLVIESARQRAFARAKYEIFQEQNAVSKWISEKMGAFKDQGTEGAIKGFLLKFALPVSTVPTNIARRIGLYAGGLPKALAYDIPKAYMKGIENLSEDEANHIGRALTKGSIGLALWTAGFYGYKHMGGLYTKYDPDKQRKDETLSEQMNLMNASVSKPWQHALPFQIMQLGATFRHIYEKTAPKDGNLRGVIDATMGSTGSILDQIPIISTGVNLVTAPADPYQEKKLGEDVKRRFEPQLLKDLGIIKDDKKKASTGRKFRN